ncbi:MAG: DUF2892 domain-containing protein [Myxococcota bacterium]|nr:DUF2892 domain-containing protein [Myxococcota bacterium]
MATQTQWWDVNEATWDRMLRIVLGVGLLALVFIGPKTWWGLLGLVPLLTGLIGRCPLYRAFGISTCGVSRTDTPARRAT